MIAVADAPGLAIGRHAGGGRVGGVGPRGDDAARQFGHLEIGQRVQDVIDQSGYGAAFCHRTGHSIGQETHGNGANMDNLETREQRRVLPRTCFSIEPGIYLPEFGVRSEVNVFVDAESNVHVTGGDPQTEIIRILS